MDATFNLLNNESDNGSKSVNIAAALYCMAKLEIAIEGSLLRTEKNGICKE
jgi:hypothetical protein